MKLKEIAIDQCPLWVKGFKFKELFAVGISKSIINRKFNSGYPVYSHRYGMTIVLLSLIVIASYIEVKRRRINYFSAEETWAIAE